MAKKGARNSGSSSGLQRNKDQAMAAMLPPSPATWRVKAADWPYHNNLGTNHREGNKSGRKPRLSLIRWCNGRRVHPCTVLNTLSSSLEICAAARASLLPQATPYSLMN